MSEHHDPLEAFDRIPAQEHHEQPTEDLRPRPQRQSDPSGPPWKPILGALVVLALLGLVLWRCSGPSDQDQAHPATSSSATSTESTSSPAVSDSADPSTVDGYGPQAPTSTKNTESSRPVRLPAAKAPKVNTADSDSVMTALLTAMNTRDSAKDIDRVTGWVRDYDRINDLASIDPYAENGLMDGRAPARTAEVTLGAPSSGQPVSTSTRKAKTAKVTVQSASGQKTYQEWELATGKDGEAWKVTEIHLVSVTGKK